MSKEAMKLALEALEAERDNYQDWDEKDGAPEYIHEAITALREALAEQPAQRKPLTDEQVTKAALWDLALSKGLITIHSEQLAPGTWSAGLSVASWMEGHTKACDISNEAAHGIKENT